MKKIILTFALLSLLAVAAEAKEPTEDRRTLHAAFGQKNLTFEAPDNMCFLDETIPEQAAAIAGMKAQAAQKGKYVLMAVFADCYQMSALGETSDPMTLPDLGMIMWMNPYIGEKASMSAEEYIGMRETSLHAYLSDAVKNYPDVEIDAEPKRNEAGVMLAYTANLEIEYQKFVVTGVTAATVLEGYPVDITLTHTSKSPITEKGRLYGVMDKLLMQQATLNRPR
jgi:hypothetical protein